MLTPKEMHTITPETALTTFLTSSTSDIVDFLPTYDSYRSKSLCANHLVKTADQKQLAALKQKLEELNSPTSKFLKKVAIAIEFKQLIMQLEEDPSEAHIKTLLATEPDKIREFSPLLKTMRPTTAANIARQIARSNDEQMEAFIRTLQTTVDFGQAASTLPLLDALIAQVSHLPATYPTHNGFFDRPRATASSSVAAEIEVEEKHLTSKPEAH